MTQNAISSLQPCTPRPRTVVLAGVEGGAHGVLGREAHLLEAEVLGERAAGRLRVGVGEDEHERRGVGRLAGGLGLEEERLGGRVRGAERLQRRGPLGRRGGGGVLARREAQRGEERGEVGHGVGRWWWGGV